MFISSHEMILRIFVEKTEKNKFIQKVFRDDIDVWYYVSREENSIVSYKNAPVSFSGLINHEIFERERIWMNITGIIEVVVVGFQFLRQSKIGQYAVIVSMIILKT